MEPSADHRNAAGLHATVLVPSYRRSDSLLRCLEAVLAGSRLPEQIVVVLRDGDDESRTQLAAWLRDNPHAEMIDVATVAEGGQAAATNAGLRIAHGDVICFIDDDTAPTREWLERLLAHYADPAVVGVGGRDIVHHGDAVSFTPAAVVGRITWYGRLIGNHHQPAFEEPRAVAHLKGANMSFRREVVRGFDTNLLGAHFTDTDASLGAGRHGRLVYDPLAAVHHYPAPRTGGFNRRSERVDELRADAHDAAYVMLKHLTGARRAGFLAFALAVGQDRRYGLLRALARLPVEGGLALRRWRAATAGLLEARRTARQTNARREDRDRART